jgi:hypothetical protein
MPNLTSSLQIFTGDTTIIDTVAQHPLLTRAKDTDGNEYIYLAGCSSTILGSWVTYDEDGATTLLAVNAVGSVAVAMAIINTTAKYGWYCVFGECEADIVANCADNAKLGRETSDGKAGDGFSAGDAITGAVSRDSTTTAAVVTVQLCYPSVNDSSA